MLNNEAPAEPVGPGPASAPVLAARRDRRPTAVVDGRAWRHRRRGILVVLRVERYADPGGPEDGARHRAAWQEAGERSLEETWRARWQERGRAPGWVEARRRDAPAADADLLRVEDHTGADPDIAVYEHLTVWGPRSVAVATIRHDQGDDEAEVAVLVDRLVHAARAGLAR